MGKLILLIIVIVLGVAYFTKPDNKACIIGGVKAVWGTMVPDEKTLPGYFEEFMDISAEGVQVKDWVLFKVVTYPVKSKDKTVAIGAFGTIFPTVQPYKTNDFIPSMPSEPKK